MKELTNYIMVVAVAMTSMIMTTACSSDSLDEEYISTDGSNDKVSTDGGVTTSTLSTMKNFTIAIDRTSEEPASTVAATYPADGDSPSENTFNKYYSKYRPDKSYCFDC